MEVKVKNLHLAYGHYTAIRNLDLTIPDGQSVVLLGQSGCGKTTTMRSIAGLESPTSGTISIGGKIVFDGASSKVVPAFKRNVGMVFQSYAVWPHKTVLENVAFPLKMKGVGRADQRKQALEVLDVVGLAHLADRGASMLSGGQMQRVALARSMAMSPSVLLLDEPLSNLDARLRDELRVELRRIQVERGLTSLYVTHDQQEALALADRIAIMQEGRITQLGTPEEIYGSPASASIASFLGVTNVFPVESASTPHSVKLRGHDMVLRTERPGVDLPSSVCIRPEDILVSSGLAHMEDPFSSTVNTFSGTVDVAVFQGSSLRCRITLSTGISVDAVCPPDGSLAAGAPVRVRIDPANVLVLPDDVREPSSELVAA
ncbi:ABC transporter ATP-binding protein [Pseudarthrobacter sp. LMD1-1-1.1]|uniref:ABC transporter ATP-binding protein n=1 Tax=Pseudarthrobacter sp. LMD1-1-1.1 TaxID=3135242 RepID=UPI00343A7CC1